ncbi:hypothetical protein P43SY_006642 [Pythium insidiosum]|uniref:Ribosomal RNA-processing protein 7 C-terminal domain-containing protein n=1 Tax=Pythium insidiosum TaxID=114742 RepID=A0AAD5M114_PYTIN|nr:hypothetical protein P43SY_006642 [Pythium insidiosum]KAJ0402180.1 hypothetical protein ATCC90586_008779 [Pythium insidiosum]
MAASALVGGYHPVALPLAHGVFKRYVYVKKHHVKDSGDTSESILAADRTVYMVNLPTDSDDDWLRECLASVGSIQHIVPGAQSDNSDPLLAKTAHVVFKSKQAAEKLLSLSAIDCAVPEVATGLDAYLAKYDATRPGLSAVKEIADRFMAEFDAQEEEQEIRHREELKNQVDDDGFVTVVSSKRKKQLAGDDLLLQQPAKKQKSKELHNFYRFQMREKKRDQLKTLRERFEEDKLLVEKLKKANKFKPE